MAEETLLIKLQFDFNQPAATIKEVENRIKTLTSTLKQIPEEGTPAFKELANSISKNIGVSIDEAERQIKEFGSAAKTEIAKGKDAVSEFNKELKQLPSAGNSINAITSQVKILEKEIKTLDVSTKEFADKSRELNKLKSELQAIKQQAGVTGRSLTELAGDVSKRFAGLNKIILRAFGFRAVGEGIRNLGRQFVNLVDEYKDSSTAIGQIDEDLSDLNNTVKQAAVQFIEANQQGISAFLTTLKEAIPVLQANAGFILQITAALALFVARQQIANAATIAGRVGLVAYNIVVKLLTGQIQFATIAQRAFNTAAKANPIGLIVTAIAAAGAAYAIFNRQSETARQATVNLIKAQGEISTEFREETKNLNGLFGALTDSTASTKEREQAIKALNAQYGEYLPNIDLEKATQEQLEQAYRATTRAIAESIIERKRTQLIEASQGRQLELILERKRATEDLVRITKELESQTSSTSGLVGTLAKNITGFDDSIQKGRKALSDARKAVSDLDKEIETNNQTIRLIDESTNEFADTLSNGLNFKNLKKDLSSADKETKASTDSIIDNLNKRKSALEESIKILIASGKDYSKQLVELGQVTKRLNDIQDEFNSVTRFSETRLEELTRRQKELQDSIRDSISNQEDYSESLSSLGVVTDELNAQQKEFDDAIKSLNKAIKEYSDGSLNDYNKQISELTEKQSNLNLRSQDYIDITAQIEELEAKRNFELALLNTNTAEFAKNQTDLNNSLATALNQEDATALALERVKSVTDATSKGASDIVEIEKQLSQDLQRIKLQDLENRRLEIGFQLADLEDAKNEELSKAGENENLKLAIIRKFNADQRSLQLEAANINTELLNDELAKYKQVQEEKTRIANDEEQKRKKDLETALDAIGQISGRIIDLISQTQTQAFEKQKEALTEAEAATIARAQQVGASEAAIQKIKEDFAKKQAALEKKQAEQQKTLAITQALIQGSLAVIRALATGGPVAAAIAGTLVAIEIALIASRKFALGGMFESDIPARQFARGGYLHSGRSHAMGGMPIINPLTGQKVAEIEKDEAIINKRTMRSNDILSLSGTPYEIASALNSYKGYGTAFPRKKFGNGGLMKRGIGNAKYQFGGRYGVSNSVIKLQSGAIFAADVNARLQKYNQNSETNKLLEVIASGIGVLNNTTKSGFESTPTATEELIKIQKLKNDEAAAS